MLSTIICGGSLAERAEYITSQLPKLHNLIHLTPDPTSIGIAQIRSLIKALSVSTHLSRIVWIEEANSLTLDSSGALLKILEEPPAQTIFYLTCDSDLSLLATVRSRCQIRRLSPNPQPLAGQAHLSTLKPLFSQTLGDRLSHQSDFPSERVELLTYFTELLAEIHSVIPKATNARGYFVLSALAGLVYESYGALKTNQNPSLALSHFLLHLPKTK